MFWYDGYTSDNEEELQTIRDTNIKYHKMESDILKGDYLIIKLPKKSSYQIMRYSLSYLYDEFCQDGWERVYHIIDENIRMANYVDIEDITENIDNYNVIKDRLIIRPINYTDNRYELKNAVYKKIGDIALVLYLVLYSEKSDFGTMKIDQKFLEKWQKNADEVWNAALINTNIFAPPRLFLNPMDTEDAPYNKGAFMAYEPDVKKLGAMTVPILTTVKQLNGAIALFYPGVQEKIAELYGGSYYVAFTSIHDVRLHKKDSIPPRNILQNIKSMNKAINKPNDILSRKVFFYDAEKKELEQIEL